MCLACIVATPRLLESRARTIEQMRLINALCRFVEIAMKLKKRSDCDLPNKKGKQKRNAEYACFR